MARRRKPQAGGPSARVRTADGMSVFAGRKIDGSKRKRSKSALRRKPRERTFTVRPEGWLDDVRAAG